MVVNAIFKSEKSCDKLSSDILLGYPCGFYERRAVLSQACVGVAFDFLAYLVGVFLTLGVKRMQ